MRYEGETQIQYTETLAVLLIEYIKARKHDHAFDDLTKYCERIETDPEYRRKEYEAFKAQ